jgi:hypothetical protein
VVLPAQGDLSSERRRQKAAGSRARRRPAGPACGRAARRRCRSRDRRRAPARCATG